MSISYYNPYPYDGGSGTGGFIPPTFPDDEDDQDPNTGGDDGSNVSDEELIGLKNRITAVENRSENNLTSINNIILDLNNAESDIEEVFNLLENINNEIDLLKQNSSNQECLWDEERITAGENTISTNRERIGEVELNISNHEQRIQNLEDGITTPSNPGDGSGVNGAVFIYDITPTIDGNVGNKTFSSEGKVLEECTVDTNFVTLSVLAITGNTNYKPVVTVDGVEVSLMEQNDSAMFTGKIEVDLLGRTSISAVHEDGAFDSVVINHESKPIITGLEFTGGYPGEQTELKEGDKFDLKVTADQAFEKIEVANESACKSQTETISEATNALITTTISDRGVTATARYAKVRIQKKSGSWSDWFTTDSFGDVDGVNTVVCNNLYPSISVDNVEYPSGQLALKNSEVATVKNTITNYDTVNYSSANGELDIDNNSIYETTKNAKRINGEYNVNNKNFEITAVRNANNSTRTVSTIINIANTAPAISIEEQYSRLRSSKTGSSYNIHVVSDQELIEAPSLIALHGTLEGDGFAGGPTRWTRSITISDADQKGTHSWNGLSAKNLAGITTSSISGDSNYIIGGFVTRKIYFEPFSNIASIGTNVIDPSKLDCVDIGGYKFSYKTSKTGESKTFTIVDSSGVINPNGDHIWINDQNWVDQNSTGLAFVELQETI